MAHVYENKLSQKELAFTTLGRAFQVDPTDEEIRLVLERLAAETESFEMLAAIYTQGMEDLEDRMVLLTLNRRLASLYRERLEDPEQSLMHLQAVVGLDPKDASTLITLENVFREREDFDSLVEVLRKRAKLFKNPEEICAQLYEVANIHEERLQDLGGAIQAYREVLEIQPQDLTALRMLDKLCLKQGRIRDLAEVLVTEIGVLDQVGERAEALDARFRLAHLYEHEFNDPKRAGVLYKDILHADPSHPATVDYLEGLLTEGGSIEGATGLLEAAYEQTGDWKKYIDILETQVRQSRVLARRIVLLRKIAEVQEDRMGLKTLAFNTYVRIFHEDLTSNEVREHLERIAAEDENLEALAAVYEEELDNVEDPEIGAPIALKVAHIQETALEDEQEAVNFYRTALRFDNKNLQALAALDRLFEKLEQYDELTEIMSREVELAQERSDHGEHRLREAGTGRQGSRVFPQGNGAGALSRRKHEDAGAGLCRA
jgi:tetratricopeptide (TPR) repeat protein